MQLFKNKQTPEARGIPRLLRQLMETKTTMSLDDVVVHYQSQKPKEIGALAYTLGSDIYLGPGQQRHLAHEIGHVVQQKAGIVQADRYIHGYPVNTSAALESQADHISDARLQQAAQPTKVIQGMFGMEFQTIGGAWNVCVDANQKPKLAPPHGCLLGRFEIAGLGSISIETDGFDLEYVTTPLPTLNELERLVACIPKIHQDILAAKVTDYQMNLDSGSSSSNDYRVIAQVSDLTTMTVSINKHGNSTVHPQATLGLCLEELPAFMERLGSLDSFGNSTQFELNSTPGAPLNQQIGVYQAVQSVKTAAKGIALSDKAIGFLVLIEHCINLAAATMMGNFDAYAYNAKNSMALMPRTSLVDLYALLENDMKPCVIAFLSEHHNPETTVVAIDERKPYPLQALLDAFQNRGQFTFGSFGELSGSDGVAKYNMLSSTGIEDHYEEVAEIKDVTQLEGDLFAHTMPNKVAVKHKKLVEGQRKGGLFEIRTLPNMVQVKHIMQSIDSMRMLSSGNAAPLEIHHRNAEYVKSFEQSGPDKDFFSKTVMEELFIGLLFSDCIKSCIDKTENEDSCRRAFENNFLALRTLNDKVDRVSIMMKVKHLIIKKAAWNAKEELKSITSPGKYSLTCVKLKYDNFSAMSKSAYEEAPALCYPIFMNDYLREKYGGTAPVKT